jgi:hypothetical protein
MEELAALESGTTMLAVRHLVAKDRDGALQLWEIHKTQGLQQEALVQEDAVQIWTTTATKIPQRTAMKVRAGTLAENAVGSPCRIQIAVQMYPEGILFVISFAGLQKAGRLHRRTLHREPLSVNGEAATHLEATK